MKLCPICEESVAKLTNPFNEKIWSTLVEWKEVPKEIANLEICKNCFLDLREALIDQSYSSEE